jgi:hypothetical protein
MSTPGGKMKAMSVLLGAVLLCVPLAHGAIQISYDPDGAGGAAAVIAAGCFTANPNPVSAGPVLCTINTIPGVSIEVVSAQSNSPGTPAGAVQSGSTLFITTTSAATFDVYFSAQDFTAPTTPPSITYASSLSTTATSGTGTISLTSCIDLANGLTPPTNPFCSTPAATLTSINNYSGQSSDADTDITTLASLTAPYALSQKISFSLGANSGMNVITSQILTPVPEPASVMFLGTALVGVGTFLRKKIRRS